MSVYLGDNKIGTIVDILTYDEQLKGIVDGTIKKINIPYGIDKIRVYAFRSCEELTNAIIPDTVTEIGYGAFWRCYKLEDVNIPNSVIKIDDLAFAVCKNFENIIIPDSVIELGDTAFDSCENVKKVIIGSSVEKIGLQCFGLCYNVLEYDFTKLISIPELGSNVFIGINENCKIYVPDNLYDEWIVADRWTTWKDYIYKASEKEITNG